MAACYTECSSNCDVNSISSSLSTTSSVSTNGGEIPSLRDLSAEAAARQDLKKVLIVDARSYAAAVGNRQDTRTHLVLIKIEIMRTYVVAEEVWCASNLVACLPAASLRSFLQCCRTKLLNIV